ncbi:glycosyltransferase family 4 protein [Aliivibrio fischeri]|uniref:glycosyltransferase family 4 protein n=1 Tax=Aliivibrio fischeri TaxID=668 RepID=UPI0007C46683|nr:glycosyltransferase family 4 protein [Aliivibrio fischeri]
MKKNTIFFFFHEGDVTGATLSLYRLINNSSIFDEYDVHIYVPQHDSFLLQKFKGYNCTLHTFPRVLSNRRKVYQLLIYFYRMFTVIKRVKPSIVYANTILSFDAVLISKILGYKSILHVHEGSDILNLFSRRVKVLGALADSFIFVSENSLNNFRKLVFLRHNFTLVPNAITDIPEIGSTIGNDTSKISLSVIGTVNRNKSQLSILSVLKEVNRNFTNNMVVLNIFGKVRDDDYLKEMNDYIQINHLEDYVHFHGEIEDIESIYRNTDIVIVASKDESFGMVTIEAFAFSKPVITSNNPGSLEIIKDGFNGLVYNYDHPHELKKSIIYLINNPIERDRIIDNGLMTLKSKYMMSNVIPHWENFLFLNMK